MFSLIVYEEFINAMNVSFCHEFHFHEDFLLFRARNQGSGQENQRKIGLLPFALGWRDRNKVLF